MTKDIAVLCADEKSHYFEIEGLDIYTKSRPMELFTGGVPIIGHPPCGQWGKFKWRAKANPREKDLAIQCIEHLSREGGVIEHPEGSDIWKLQWPKGTKFQKVNLHQFGFKAKKTTILAWYKYKPIEEPLNFNAIHTTIERMDKKHRHITPPTMCKWLVESIRNTKYRHLGGKNEQHQEQHSESQSNTHHTETTGGTVTGLL